MRRRRPRCASERLTTSSPTLDLREDLARLDPADALPFGREPAASARVETKAPVVRFERPSTSSRTLDLREDLARLDPADALPFGREPAGGVKPAVSAHVEAKAPVVRF